MERTSPRIRHQVEDEHSRTVKSSKIVLEARGIDRFQPVGPAHHLPSTKQYYNSSPSRQNQKHNPKPLTPFHPKMRLPYVDNPPNFTSEDDKQVLERVKARRGERGLLPLDLALLHAPKVADGTFFFILVVQDSTQYTVHVSC